MDQSDRLKSAAVVGVGSAPRKSLETSPNSPAYGLALMPNPLFRRRSHLPYFLELVASLVARTLYRVRTSGAENIPVKGGVLLIANHISYVDVIVLQLTCPRPIRIRSSFWRVVWRARPT